MSVSSVDVSLAISAILTVLDVTHASVCQDHVKVSTPRAPTSASGYRTRLAPPAPRARGAARGGDFPMHTARRVPESGTKAAES